MGPADRVLLPALPVLAIVTAARRAAFPATATATAATEARAARG
ncbi:hypothetical protein ACWGIB_09035 [Streptomyces xiamenensis]